MAEHMSPRTPPNGAHPAAAGGRGRASTRRRARAAGAALLAIVALVGGSLAAQPAVAPLPARLSATGLYVDGSVGTVAAGILPFSPQYPLWSDGAAKRRWLSLPPGTAIDASDPDAWVFPPGTRLWKEFSLGRRIETRYSERLADGSWRFAVYAWNEDGSDAVLVGEDGRSVAVADAPQGVYRVPSRSDCLACHGSAAVPVLGVGLLQLSPDRDPLAPHAEPRRADDVDLRQLVANGRLVGLPMSLLEQPPRIAARSPEERAVLGYLHGNCGHCHRRPSDPAMALPLALTLAHASTDPAATDVLGSLLDSPSRYRPARWPGEPRPVVAGDPDASVLRLRMRSRIPLVQMPPLGSARRDDDALALIEHWIDTLPATDKDTDR